MKSYFSYDFYNYICTSIYNYSEVKLLFFCCILSTWMWLNRRFFVSFISLLLYVDRNTCLRLFIEFLLSERSLVGQKMWYSSCKIDGQWKREKCFHLDVFKDHPEKSRPMVSQDSIMLLLSLLTISTLLNIKGV